MTASSPASPVRPIRVALVLTVIALVGYLALLLGAEVVSDIVFAVGIVILAACALAGLVFGVRALRSGAGRALAIGTVIVSALVSLYLLGVVALLFLLRP